MQANLELCRRFQLDMQFIPGQCYEHLFEGLHLALNGGDMHHIIEMSKSYKTRVLWSQMTPGRIVRQLQHFAQTHPDEGTRTRCLRVLKRAKPEKYRCNRDKPGHGLDWSELEEWVRNNPEKAKRRGRP
jgi:hypothetical protein